MSRVPTELFDCDRVNGYLESYLMGQVPPPERRGMRLHIHGCPSCFEKVMARDPILLLAPLADEERPEEFWDGFWPAIRAGIEQSGVDDRRRRGRVVFLRVAAAIVLFVAAAGIFVGTRWGTPGRSPAVIGPAVERIAAPAVIPEGAEPLPQTVELVRSGAPGQVQVYSMEYVQDAGDAEVAGRLTELVLIVDAGIEL